MVGLFVLGWAGLVIAVSNLSQGYPAGAVLGLFLLAGPIAYLWSRASAPARERRQEEQDREKRQRHLEQWQGTRPAVLIAQADDPVTAAQHRTSQAEGCAFLGLDAEDSEWMVAHRQQAVLVLGPPRSGKTSSLIVPSVLNASGPVVSTSTKDEVLQVTARARSRMGRVWLFDPSGTEQSPPGVLELHWSPVWQSRTWDGARAMADAMVGASAAGGGVENATHWTQSAKTLLAPLLHAAALGEKTISDVRRWITAGVHSPNDLAVPGEILDMHGATLAADDLDAINGIEARERSGVFSSARIVVDAYGSEAVTKRSQVQNFDADAFVRSRDTVYITAPSHLQTMLAPLVAGLLEEVRNATYRLARTRRDANSGPPVFWALDEVANIAPLKNLPGIVSEAGGQGLQVMACLQDLSQAKARWGVAAEGFLSLFGTKVIFPGIGDKATLEALSTMAGDWDRPYTVYNSNTGRSTTYGLPLGVSEAKNSGEGWTYSVQREARITPGEMANIPDGHVLLLRSGHWRLVQTTPFYRADPWRQALAKAPADIENQGGVDMLAGFETRRQHIPET